MEFKKYLPTDQYATYNGVEFRLTRLENGYATLTTKEAIYQDEKFRFIQYELPYGKIDPPIYIKKVKIGEISNAYDLSYKAIYKGHQFDAGVSNAPEIILFADPSGDYHLPKSLGFKEVNKYEWEKIVDISEVEIITIKEPIDLNSLL